MSERSTTEGRENANNKYRTATGGRERRNELFPVPWTDALLLPQL